MQDYPLRPLYKDIILVNSEAGFPSTLCVGRCTVFTSFLGAVHLT